MALLVIFSIFEMENLTVKAQDVFANTTSEQAQPQQDNVDEVRVVEQASIIDEGEGVSPETLDSSQNITLDDMLNKEIKDSEQLTGEDIEKLELEKYPVFVEESELPRDTLLNETVESFIGPREATSADFMNWTVEEKDQEPIGETPREFSIFEKAAHNSTRRQLYTYDPLKDYSCIVNSRCASGKGCLTASSGIQFSITYTYDVPGYDLE